jgi:hypothetical protein
MKIKKNGVTINLTEGDIKKLRKSIIKEGNEERYKWMELEKVMRRFYPESKNYAFVTHQGIARIMAKVFKDGSFNARTWREVCRYDRSKGLCDIFPKGEVLEVFIKTIKGE